MAYADTVVRNLRRQSQKVMRALSCVSLPEAIGYAEKMPGSVVTVMEDTNTALDINNPDSDFTIDINGHKIDDISVNNGKITIIASKTGGYVKGELDIQEDSTVTIGDVKISGNDIYYGSNWLY